jgi:broad specificity phosphatase PhoE
MSRRAAELAMPHFGVEADDGLVPWDYGTREGGHAVDIEACIGAGRAGAMAIEAVR